MSMSRKYAIFCACITHGLQRTNDLELYRMLAGPELDFIHLGNEHRQQLTWVAIGNGSFLNVGDKTRHSKIPSF
jgi:hypothetical protein